MTSPEHAALPRWFELPEGEDGAVRLGELKETLSRRGINSRGWRLYLDYGDAIFLPLGRAWIDPENHPLSAPHNAIAWLRLLQACEMDVLPPVQLVRSIAAWKVPGVRLERIPPLFLRAAWKACIGRSIDWGGCAPSCATDHSRRPLVLRKRRVSEGGGIATEGRLELAGAALGRGEPGQPRCAARGRAGLALAPRGAAC